MQRQKNRTAALALPSFSIHFGVLLRGALDCVNPFCCCCCCCFAYSCAGVAWMQGGGVACESPGMGGCSKA